MLATLVTMNLYTGIAIIVTKGKSISKFPKQYLYFGNHTFLKIPIPMWILILAILICTVILYKTVYGFQIKFIGSNLKASIFTGMKSKSVLFRTYVLTGILCSMAGLVALSRTGSAKADYGTSYVSQAILCCVLGATNPSGGYAKIS
jgi:simple sugar transport system permease protein